MVAPINQGQGTDDAVDAFRHAYVSGVYAMERGEVYADILGWANEIRGDIVNGQLPESKNMDLWNNEVGRNLAQTATSKADLAQKIATALDLGELITDPFTDTREFTGNRPTPSQSQFDDLNNNHSDALEGGGGGGNTDLDPPRPPRKPEFPFPEAPDTPPDLWDWLKGLISPLTIDLDKDGIELVSLENSTHYWDIDNDGMGEATGWVGADDGLLAIDLNADGIITNHTELFGDEFTDGFTMLAPYDTNADGVVDNKDAQWGDLLVWQDVQWRESSRQLRVV